MTLRENPTMAQNFNFVNKKEKKSNLKDLRTQGKPFKHAHKPVVRERSSRSYNPFELKRKREFYKNAKNVKKYKKLVRKLEEEGNANLAETVGPSTDFEKVDFEGEAKKQFDHINDKKVPGERLGRKEAPGSHHERNKSKNTVQKLREEYERQKQEKERIKKEREAALVAKRAAQEEAEMKRKNVKLKMCKKTRSGQPVMKYRVEQLLEKISKSNQ